MDNIIRNIWLTTHSSERRLGAQPSSHKLHNSNANSPAPAGGSPIVGAASSGNYARSRLGQQVHPRSSRRAVAVAQDDEDMDAEGEDDDEADGDEAEDKGIYCICQQMSHGEVCDGVFLGILC
jgi:hypothetical protein